MISLEGRQLWILGLLPIRRDTILWSKFVFAAIGSVVPCTMLILISDLMLEIPWKFILLHQLSCVVLCLGLSAIAVGLGAKMPDLAERSPSKIAAGFGGTLNLVISAGFIAVVVLLTALAGASAHGVAARISVADERKLLYFPGKPDGRGVRRTADGGGGRDCSCLPACGWA